MSEEDKHVNNIENNSDDENENEEIDIEQMGEPDLLNMFQCFFTNDDGDNVVDVLSSLKKSIDTQNKILMKMLNSLPVKSEKA